MTISTKLEWVLSAPVDDKLIPSSKLAAASLAISHFLCRVTLSRRTQRLLAVEIVKV